MKATGLLTASGIRRSPPRVRVARNAHKPGTGDSRNLLSHGSGGRMPEMQVWSGRCVRGPRGRAPAPPFLLPVAAAPPGCGYITPGPAPVLSWPPPPCTFLSRGRWSSGSGGVSPGRPRPSRVACKAPVSRVAHSEAPGGYKFWGTPFALVRLPVAPVPHLSWEASVAYFPSPYVWGFEGPPTIPSWPCPACLPPCGLV